jgi:protein-tyrosine phosphatase
VIDIHSHLIPAVDDGSPSVEVSLGVLARFGADGVARLVCTPHLRASQVHEFDESAVAGQFAALVAAAPATPALSRGWEIMLDIPGVDLRAPWLALAGSSAVLVEFPHSGVPTGATAELFRLRMSGIVPVLAHPERYIGCTPEMVREWKQVGVVMQIDAVALTVGGPMGKLARALLAEGLADCLSSDNHGDDRSLGGARQWLLELDATEQADLLTSTNAGRLLTNRPVLPVGPIEVHKGLVGRLRALLGRT